MEIEYIDYPGMPIADFFKLSDTCRGWHICRKWEYAIEICRWRTY